MKPQIVIFWSRLDFRLNDNPGLFAAASFARENQIPFLPILVLDTNILNDPSNNNGYPRRHYIAQAIAHFSANFPYYLIFKNNDPATIWSKISQKYTINLYTNLNPEPYQIKRDQSVKKILEEAGSSYFTYRDQLTIDPKTVSGSGNIYSVFTPFRNNVLESFLNAKVTPIAKVDDLSYFTDFNDFNNVGEFILAGKQTIYGKDFSNEAVTQNQNSKLSKEIFSLIDTPWTLQIQTHTKSETNLDILQNHIQQIPYLKLKQDDSKNYILYDLDQLFERPNLTQWDYSEAQALKRLEKFNSDFILNYKVGRDALDTDGFESSGTSRLSPALKWGLISARTMAQKIIQTHGDPRENESVFAYISELIWREFYKYILFHHPKVLNEEFQLKYRDKISWKDDLEGLDLFTKWLTGSTGYKLVDAAMFEIRKIGWMHNRARMVVGSVLTKNLGVDWRWGQEAFRALLVDLDEASNNGGWQWAASTGADPKPIRIFNPYLQAQKYDSNNNYIKTWLPESYNLTSPVIEHPIARQEALVRYGLGTGFSGARDY